MVHAMQNIRARFDSWCHDDVPSTGFGARFNKDRKARGETRAQAAARLGVPSWKVWLVEWSIASRNVQASLGVGIERGPVEPRWRQVMRGGILLLLMVGNAFSVIGYCARWTGLRSLTEKVGLAIVLWAAAFLVWRGWIATGPNGEYEGAEAFLFMRMNNALAFGLLAALVMGWFANVLTSARSLTIGALAASACLLAYGASVVPLYLVNRDAVHQRDRMAEIHADFRRETNWVRERAKVDPAYDGVDARRAAALKMLQETEMPVAKWMKDKRAFILHKSIVAACLEAVERHEVEPESCMPKEIQEPKDIDRLKTFAFLFRSQF